MEDKTKAQQFESTNTEAKTLWNLMQTHITEVCKHLRACALKPFSLHFFNPSFGLTNLDGRLLTLPVDAITILTLGQLPRKKYNWGICVHTTCETAFWPRKLGCGRASTSHPGSIGSTRVPFCSDRFLQLAVDPVWQRTDLGNCPVWKMICTTTQRQVRSRPTE